jgi:glycosyltransferase involved in cell wall biosynthesis
MNKKVEPLISVCIPVYNRPEELSILLDSIVRQDYNDYEIVVCDDKSPLSDKIEKVVSKFIKEYPNIIISYFKNDKNLGYDGNLRNLFHKANGIYCLFMGDDDLLAEGALMKVGMILEKHLNIGVVLRSWSSIDRTTNQTNHVFRYFDKDKFFVSGVQTVITFFRRSIFISGLVINRKEAIKYDTEIFDGTLLYQLYLISNILIDMNGLYISDIIAIRKVGGIVHFFGSSEKEKGKYLPKVLLPEHSLNFMNGMLEIAKYVQNTKKVQIYDSILKDIGNYSYAILSMQAENLNRIDFIKYSINLAKIGLWKNIMFYGYFILLFIFKPRIVDEIINIIKRIFGYTPLIGNVYTGKVIK